MSLLTPKQATWCVVIGLSLVVVIGYFWFWPGQLHSQVQLLPHRHQSSLKGGVIVPVGADHYHAEIWLLSNRRLKLFTLGQDERLIQTVPQQTVKVYLRFGMSRETIEAEFRSIQQPSDPAGQVSQFEAELLTDLPPGEITGLIPAINWGERTYRIAFMLPADLVRNHPEKKATPAK